MNLTCDAWVPVVFADGEARLVSLAEAFGHGEEILDLIATPPQRIALTRLLVCITQAALGGPENEAGWRSCRECIVPAALAYLDRWKDRFELFGHHAFLQVANLEETGNATLDKLDFGLAAGNNAVLFDHGATPDGRWQSAAWSALMLLTYQCFSPGGRIGVTTWKGTATTGSSEHAPSLEGSMLHTIIRGASLLDTVCMNLLTKDMVESGATGGWGRPAWEEMPQGPDDRRIAALTTCYLGRLVPISRGIRLNDGHRDVTLVNGCSYPKLPHREPAATVVRRVKDEQLAYLGINLSKHPWRDLGSILASSRSLTEGGPWVLGHLVHGEGRVDLWTGGLAANKGKVLDVAEWTFHLPLSLVGEAALRKFQRGVKLADDASSRLWAAIAAYFEDLAVSEFRRNDQQSRRHRQRVVAKAGAYYWRTLDATYAALIEAANEPAMDLGGEWYTLIRSAMEHAYEVSCPHGNARQIRAFAKGKQKLWLQKPGHGNATNAA